MTGINYKTIVQIDGDPLEDRKTADGKWRPLLNDKERLLLRRRQMTDQIVSMLLVDRKEIPEIAQALEMSPEELSNELLYGDLEGTRKAFIDRVIEKILDLKKARTRAELCKELGLTRRQLDYLMSSDDFREAYALAFHDIRSDPNINAVRQAVVEELLPKAYQMLERELTEGTWPVRQRARQDIFKLAGIDAIKPAEDEREEFVKFLEKHDIKITKENKPALPEEYQEAMEKYLPDVVDAQVTNVVEDTLKEAEGEAD
jgi:hypothetical protein